MIERSGESSQSVGQFWRLVCEEEQDTPTALCFHIQRGLRTDSKEMVDNETQDLATSDWEVGVENLDRKAAMCRHGEQAGRKSFH